MSCTADAEPAGESVPPSLVEAYARAHYAVELPHGQVVLSVTGVERGDRAVLPGTSLTVITACNPGTNRPGELLNQQANRRLEQQLVALGQLYYPAQGYSVDRSHVEPSFAVEGLSREASVGLGRQFRQACVFYWDGARGELLWCGVPPSAA